MNPTTSSCFSARARTRRTLRAPLWLTAVVLVQACSLNPPNVPAGEQRPLLQLPGSETPRDLLPPTAADRGNATGQAVAQTAAQMLGTPYVYGGKNRTGFDCSGLVYFAYRKAGLRVPRTSRAQLRASRRIALAQARPGDLLFFRSTNLSHVAIYVGDGEFIHAPSTGKRVSRASLDNNWYHARLVAVGRLAP